MEQYQDIRNDIVEGFDLVVQHYYILIPFALYFGVKLYIYLRQKRIQKFMRCRADEVLKQLRALNIKNDGAKMFGLMRSMSPFAFEEMILTALSDRGFKIKRNGWYMGDGGLDGQFWIGRQKVLIQAKRYKNHIDRLHVEDFVKLCARKRCKGIFVHTGRTGKKAWDEANAAKHVEIISGQALLNLFVGRRLVLFGKEYFG